MTCHNCTHFCKGHAAGGAVGWGTALQARSSRVRFPIDINPSLAALWPWGRYSLELKWVPGVFPGGKDDRCLGLTTLLLSFADCLEIWKPQPSGTLRACPGIALPWFKGFYFSKLFSWMTAVSFQGHLCPMVGVLMFWVLKDKEPNPILAKYWRRFRQ
jgi:hypothetical protein